MGAGDATGAGERGGFIMGLGEVGGSEEGAVSSDRGGIALRLIQIKRYHWTDENGCCSIQIIFLTS